MGCESGVLPVLGTGSADFAFVDGARVVCETVADYEAETLSDVRVIAYADGEFAELKQAAAEIRSEN